MTKDEAQTWFEAGATFAGTGYPGPSPDIAVSTQWMFDRLWTLRNTSPIWIDQLIQDLLDRRGEDE